MVVVVVVVVSGRARKVVVQGCRLRRRPAVSSQDKLVEEFNFLKVQAVEPMATFMEYITCAERLSSPPQPPETHPRHPRHHSSKKQSSKKQSSKSRAAKQRSSR